MKKKFISQTSAEINANINPPACVIKVRMRDPEDRTPEYEELLNGWEKWGLEDIMHRLNSADWRFCVSASGPFGEVVFLKLLEAANNPNIPFELIEEVVRTALRTRVGSVGTNVFTRVAIFDGEQMICDFFKEFIKHGKIDDRYYNLIYEMLTNQTVENISYPLGFLMPNCTGWDEEVFAKLPSEMQKRLSSKSFHAGEKSDRCYALLSNASFGM